MLSSILVGLAQADDELLSGALGCVAVVQVSFFGVEGENGVYLGLFATKWFQVELLGSLPVARS